jgi:hypothetical protein
VRHDGQSQVRDESARDEERSHRVDFELLEQIVLRRSVHVASSKDARIVNEQINSLSFEFLCRVQNRRFVTRVELHDLERLQRFQLATVLKESRKLAHYCGKDAKQA